MVEAGISTEQPKHLKVDPVKEVAIVLDNWLDLFYRLGMATRKTNAGSSNVNPQSLERSVYNREQRANLRKGLLDGSRTLFETRKLTTTLDEFDRSYLNQGAVNIDIPGLGIQSGQYASIELSSIETEKKGLPPIFLIPALSGDLNGVRPLVREAAMQGRRVVVLAYPDSLAGKVTPEFVEASIKSPSFEPHTAYFKNAIKMLIGETPDFELWGFSNGGGIVSEILSDPKFQERVSNAVILAPGGGVDQSVTDIIKGIAHDFAVLGKPGEWSDSVTILPGQVLSTKEHYALWKKLFQSGLINKVGKNINKWGDMKVKEGGKIIVLTGGKDQITKSYRLNDNLSHLPNNQVHVVGYPEAYHVSFVTKAARVVEDVRLVRDNPHIPRLVSLSL